MYLFAEKPLMAYRTFRLVINASKPLGVSILPVYKVWIKGWDQETFEGTAHCSVCQEVPGMDCSCGLHAYTKVDDAMQLSKEPEWTENYIGAIVTLGGRVIPHPNAARAEVMSVEAFFEPNWAEVPAKANAYDKLTIKCDHLKIPILMSHKPFRDVEFAREYAESRGWELYHDAVARELRL